jgi:molybdenum cofactor synthesis domain-containing protein
MSAPQPRVTASVLLIGDELLSGRTRDINLQQIATFLAPLGVDVVEARTVPDVQDAIVEALNALRVRCTYVFTTGGIGPTHDDITVDAVAVALGVPVVVDPDAYALLEARYREAGTEFTPARQRMARVPQGAGLIENPVSGAPGIAIGNVFVLAGVPAIARGMLDSIGRSGAIKGGAVVHTLSLRVPGLREGDVGQALGELALAHGEVSIGSYPWYVSPEDSGVHLVARGRDRVAVEAAAEALTALVARYGREAERVAG